MKKIILLSILLFIVAIVIGSDDFLDLPKTDETFNSNLDTTTKAWLNENVNNIHWSNMTVTNDGNMFKMKFCYTINQSMDCTKITLIRNYAKESLYCAEWGNGCLEHDKINPFICINYNASYELTCEVWANIPLADMLEIRYVEKADDVLARVYRDNNKPQENKIDVGNKTIDVGG